MATPVAAMTAAAAIYIERADRDGRRALRVEPTAGGVHVLVYGSRPGDGTARTWLTWEQWDELLARVDAARRRVTQQERGAA